jgi:DNA-directed RNA polymerase subunit M/transcription elongation factor TFIIS
MRTTCPNCNNALTIREVIEGSCSKCASMEKSRHAVGGGSSSSSNIKTNFDVLISEELKKQRFKSAA